MNYWTPTILNKVSWGKCSKYKFATGPIIDVWQWTKYTFVIKLLCCKTSYKWPIRSKSSGFLFCFNDNQTFQITCFKLKLCGVLKCNFLVNVSKPVLAFFKFKFATPECSMLQRSISIPLENARKPQFFWHFQGVEMEHWAKTG